LEGIRLEVWGVEQCYPERRYPVPNVPARPIGVIILRGSINTEPSLLHCERLEWSGRCGESGQNCNGPIPSEIEVREQVEGDWGKYEMVGKDPAVSKNSDVFQIRKIHLMNSR